MLSMVECSYNERIQLAPSQTARFLLCALLFDFEEVLWLS
jgi:hypothetical protein